MDRSIYIVLSQSYTVLARVIKLITKEKYSHVSLSFDKECENMYTMGRRWTRWPFSGIYKKESIYKGVYNLNKNAEILIYELKVTNEQYNNIKELLDKYGNSSKGYNVIGLVLAMFNKKVDRNKYYCSEFLYKILSDESVGIFPKTNDVVKPMDFVKIKGLNKIYEGKVMDYKMQNSDIRILNEKISI